MSKKLARGAAAGVLAAAALFGTIAPTAAAADNPPQQKADDEVVVVDEPDTSNLNNKWTVDVAGVPILGLLDSLMDVPKKLGLGGTGGY